MSVVSYETAVRLRDAGFPKAKPEFGRIYFGPKTGKRHLYHRPEWPAWGMYVEGDYGSCGVEYFDDLIYAPTAEDILRELPEWHFLSREGDVWACDVYQNWMRPGYTAPNPAEAAALKWLAKKFTK